jgi:hypothetical protein
MAITNQLLLINTISSLDYGESILNDRQAGIHHCIGGLDVLPCHGDQTKNGCGRATEDVIRGLEMCSRGTDVVGQEIFRRGVEDAPCRIELVPGIEADVKRERTQDEDHSEEKKKELSLQNLNTLR